MPSTSTRRPTRSRDDRYIAGVCGGLAQYLNMEPTLVRLLVVLLTVLSAATITVPAYIVAILLMPESDRPASHLTPGPPVPGWQPWQASQQKPVDPVWGREGAPWEQPQPHPSAGAAPEPPVPPQPRPGGNAPTDDQV